MHEASIVESLIKLLKTELEKAGAKRLLSFSLAVGEMTGYMEDSLKFYYDIMSEDESLKNAVMKIRYIKPLFHCPKCDKDFERKRFSFDCPVCGTPGLITKTGSEFYIEDIEVEK